MQNILDVVTKFFAGPANLDQPSAAACSRPGSASPAASFGVVIVLILTLYFIASLNSIKRGMYLLVPASKRAGSSTSAEQISTRSAST